MSREVVVTALFAGRLRRALGQADVGDSGVSAESWRRERDRLLDLLDPGAESLLQGEDSRAVIDLLSESSPVASSRTSGQDWNVEIESIVGELLAATR